MANVTVGKLLNVIDVTNTLGEGVQWHALSQCIWWTDIQESCLYSYSTKSSQLNKHTMPERVGCFAFIENDPRIIVAFASGIAFYDFSSKSLEWIDKPEEHIKGNRFNDGRVDRQGRFWYGSLVENKESSEQSAFLYMLNSRGKSIAKETNIEIANGLCWSPDGKTLYHADSPQQKIHQYDFNTATTELSNKKLFAKTAPGSFPDGSTIDSDGYLWNAQWGGSRVVRYNPQGEIDLCIDVPVSQPSCVAFGGPNLDWLMITSARQDLSENELSQQPLAGNLFIYQVNGTTGLEENKFILP
ncbi:SMP-30/gluconolactonase/LRE family protein [Thalassotalea crassostreae]|uniref:SMP-30/gluconolactonase/LRE family protein n=1 Tax=Thalassotalea crassostreae TaxID=1763536 RepID=UPI000838BDEF|nr:SMP-30/gluconolactonase/LRE family protein [Thalassotalea crassostreae]